MTSKPDNLTPGAQYIYERTYERELRVDPINIPLTSELSNLIKGKSMTYKPYKGDIRNPCAEISLSTHDRQLLTAKEIMETQPMTEKGDIEIAYRYMTEKGAPDGYISGRPVYRDEAGTLSYSGKSTGSPTATGYTEINPPPVAKEDLASTYNVYAETAVTNDYDEDYDDDCDDKSEPYTPGYHNYEAYKPSLGKLDCQKLNTLGTFASADISHMTRLERITAGLEKDPYVAHRNSYKGVCEKGCEYGLAWATDLQKPKPVVGIQDQSGEEFEIWDSMSATYMNKK